MGIRTLKVDRNGSHPVVSYTPTCTCTCTYRYTCICSRVYLGGEVLSCLIFTFPMKYSPYIFFSHSLHCACAYVCVSHCIYASSIHTCI